MYGSGISLVVAPDFCLVIFFLPEETDCCNLYFAEIFSVLWVFLHFTFKYACFADKILSNWIDWTNLTFLFAGAKFTMNSNNIRIIEKTGTSLVLESEDTRQRLAEETQHLLEYVKQCRQQCLELESVIESVQQRCSTKGQQFFPVIIGRRPNVNLNDSQRSHSTSDPPSSLGMDSVSTPSSGSGRPPTVSYIKKTMMICCLSFRTILSYGNVTIAIVISKYHWIYFYHA